MQYRFYPAADARQDEIWEYSCEQWGEAQAEKYIRGLHGYLKKVAERRVPWHKLPKTFINPEPAVAVYFVRYESHYVFFRELSADTIGIMTILHGAMNIPVRLRGDLLRIEAE